MLRTLRYWLVCWQSPQPLQPSPKAAGSVWEAAEMQTVTALGETVGAKAMFP